MARFEMMPPQVTENPFTADQAKVWQDYFLRQNAFIQGVAKLTDTQAWTGQNKFIQGSEVANTDGGVSGMSQWAVKASRVVGAGGALTQGSTGFFVGRTQAGTRQQTWNVYSFVDDYSNPTDLLSDPVRWGYTGAVGVYSKAHKHGVAPIWSGVFEAQDDSGSDYGQMYGIEVSIQSNSLDPNNYRRGIAIFYGSINGGTSQHFAGMDIEPFGNQTNAQLVYGYLVNGKVTTAFGSGTVVAIGMYLAGQYSTSAIQLRDMRNTPYSITVGDGSRMRFITSQNSGGGGLKTWWPVISTYTPTWSGVLEIVIDSTVRYIPVASNKPT